MGQIISGDFEVFCTITNFVAGKLAENGPVDVDEPAAFGHCEPPLVDLMENTHPVSGVDGVSSDVDRRATRTQMVGAFNDSRVVAGRAAINSGRNTGDVGSRNEDPQNFPFVLEEWS